MSDNVAYVLAIDGAHELLVNCGNPPVSKSDRGYVITHLERMLFKEGTVPLEFRAVSDAYIAKGPSALTE